MKEQEIDKYIGKFIKVTDFENSENVGKLYKIVNSRTHRNGCEMLHAINKGYYLETPNGVYAGIDYRQSHIKKINIVV